MFHLELLEPLFCVPDQRGATGEEKINLSCRSIGSAKVRVCGRILIVRSNTHLFKRPTAGLRIETVDTNNGKEIEDSMDVESVRSEAAEHVWCSQRYGPTSKTPPCIYQYRGGAKG